jgi:cation diffusion facilitator family transporter
LVSAHSPLTPYLRRVHRGGIEAPSVAGEGMVARFNLLTHLSLSDPISKTAAASIAVALVVMGIKAAAYWVTGSAALYSDALESIVNVVTAIAALITIGISAKPADSDHPFGHHKAEYFSAVLEGALIIVAALLILEQAYGAWLQPQALTHPLGGMLINGLATVINAAWSWFLITRGRQWRSPALVADGWHILTDVWTSLAVLAGLAFAWLTGWAWLDPLLAALVAINILWTGYRLTMGSLSGLLDEAVSPDIQKQIHDAIKSNGGGAHQVHDIRTRHAGRATFIEFHLVVPGDMTVRESHAICDRLEDALEATIPGSDVTIHVEPDHKAKVAGAVEI